MRIQISDLSKTYRPGSPPALDHLDLTIAPGTFGLLGPNGAGKTTLIQILSTQMAPSGGSVRFDDLDLQRDRAQVRRRLGYLPQYFGAYPQMSAWEFLDYMARLAGLGNGRSRRDRIEEVLESVALTTARDRKTGTFSGGMRRRLGIAQAILANPDFVIVDEPTVGLDPEERIRFRGILSRLGRDRTVLISTHIVGDISSTCGEIAVLRRGRLVFHGPPEELVRRATGRTWTVETTDDRFDHFARRFGVASVGNDGGRLLLRLVGDETPEGGRPAAPDLEDAYLYFMGNDAPSRPAA